MNMHNDFRGPTNEYLITRYFQAIRDHANGAVKNPTMNILQVLLDAEEPLPIQKLTQLAGFEKWRVVRDHMETEISREIILFTSDKKKNFRKFYSINPNFRRLFNAWNKRVEADLREQRNSDENYRRRGEERMEKDKIDLEFGIVKETSMLTGELRVKGFKMKFSELHRFFLTAPLDMKKDKNLDVFKIGSNLTVNRVFATALLEELSK